MNWTLIYQPPKEIFENFYEIPSNTNFCVPIFYTHPLNQVQPNIKRAIIIIHGSGRNNNYVKYVLEQYDNYKNNVLIIQPQFLIKFDLENLKVSKKGVLYWNELSWKHGDNSENPEFKMSSFEVMDHIIDHICNSKNFPNLEIIVMAGHSGGAQFVHRYSFVSPIFERSKSIQKWKFIVMNPGSYLYINSLRYSKELNTFVEPSEEEKKNCIDYNHYKYGLENLNDYLKHRDIDHLIREYEKKDVHYLIGEKDNDPNERILDKSCGAILQGLHRLERAENYYKYLEYFYGKRVHKLWKFEGLK